MKIFDDDITVRDVAPTLEQTEEAEEAYLDDAPTVEGLVDERPELVQQLEAFREGKAWKTLGDKGGRHDSDSDSDASPVRRQRHDSGSDQSPARNLRHDSGSDQSPVRRQRQDSDSDQSPVRRQTRDSDSDQSPPRRQKQGKSKHASDSDQSPPRRKNNSDFDQSPPRRRNNSDSDQSPPRKSSKSDDAGKSSRRQRPSRFAPVEKPEKVDQDDKGRSKKTLSGLTAGLSTARAMRMENDAKRQREQQLFDKADESTLGKGARTVFRDKETGRRRNLAQESEAEAKENAIKEELLNKYKAWGKGLKQASQQSARVQEALHEADKPLARGRADGDLEDLLKDKERDGDPMLAYVRKKKQKTKSAVKEVPRYRGPQPPANRFNIWPGYRWDGVDRSNGFEKSLFQKGAERKAVAEDAYKWSIEDM